MEDEHQSEDPTKGPRMLVLLLIAMVAFWATVAVLVWDRWLR